MGSAKEGGSGDMADYRLHSQVNRYLEGRITLEQLEEWIVTRWRQLFALPHSGASDLAGSIERGLAEISDGVTTEDEFKQTLLEALRREATTGIAYTEIAQTETSNSSGLVFAAMVIPTESVAALQFAAAYT